MLKQFILILTLAFPFYSMGQEPTEQLFALKQLNNSIGVGNVTLTDPYLSPFEYSGAFLYCSQKTMSLVTPTNSKLSYTLGGNYKIGNAKHPNYGNKLYFFDINFFGGMNKHYSLNNQLLWLLGGDLDVTIGGKYMPRNINNPFSLDLNSNINVTSSLLYDFLLFKQPLKCSYNVKVPIMGTMFVPLRGLTYYEMSTVGSWADMFHFSSFHNRMMIKQDLNLDILLHFSTFRLSIQHQMLKYNANNMTFKNNQLYFSVGTIVHLYKFRGNRAKSVKNLIPVL